MGRKSIYRTEEEMKNARRKEDAARRAKSKKIEDDILRMHPDPNAINAKGAKRKQYIQETKKRLDNPNIDLEYDPDRQYNEKEDHDDMSAFPNSDRRLIIIAVKSTVTANRSSSTIDYSDNSLLSMNHHI